MASATGPLARVQLRLVRDFVYGDTLATLPVEVREITEAWSPDGLPSDTTLATGPVLTTGTLAAQDTLVTFDLPAAYIAANTTALRDSLDALFEGFQIRVPEGMGPTPGAVIGFNAKPIGHPPHRRGLPGRRRDHARHGGLPPRRGLHGPRAAATPAAPPTGSCCATARPRSLALDFDLDALNNVPLANATFRIPLDRGLLDTGMAFNRPLVRVGQPLRHPRRQHPHRHRARTDGARRQR